MNSNTLVQEHLSQTRASDFNLFNGLNHNYKDGGLVPLSNHWQGRIKGMQILKHVKDAGLSEFEVTLIC